MASGAVDFPVVCLGGSAGALQAYLEILRSVPADVGLAFIILSHRGSDDAELLPELLSRSTKMPVLEVEEGMALRRDAVFLCPPDKELSITSSTFHVHPRSTSLGWPRSITLLLKSLAAAVGHRIIAVILSGMGADGSAALTAVKASGGRILVQSGAPYESMPTNAIETGLVDRILTPSQIAADLVNCCKVLDRADRVG
jgi:two-component system CheB/CheR fusion protein